jgi:hypothetical protein
MSPRRLVVFLLALLAVAGVAAGCGGGDEGDGSAAASQPASSPAEGITEDNLPPGFSKAPTVEIEGKEYRFDDIPGHYWKLLDSRGYAIGLHFQTDRPFPWAQNVAKGQLLYLIYAVPGTCGDGNYAEAVKAPDATAFGPVPPGFDHWHAFVGGGSRVGTWYTHIAVRDFNLAGPPGNPFEGEKINAGEAKFLPVCDIR